MTDWEWAIKYDPSQPRVPAGQSGGGRWSSGGGTAGTLTEAQGHSYTQSDVLDSVMEINPPIQVTQGRMTAGQWAKEYMTDEPGGYALIKMHPKAALLPMQADSPEKVQSFVGQEGQSAPPILLDSNEKIQARFGGGMLDRAGGRQPYTVIDGKHRVEAALQRGDNSVLAFVPKRKLKEVWDRSHAQEVEDFALDYFKKKGYPVLKNTGNGILVNRNGMERMYTVRDFDKIARNLGHEWMWGK